MSETKPRDFVGYGPTPPAPALARSARVAVSFVLNYEEGGERNVLDGDSHAETFLSDMHDPAPFPARHLSVESLYEYGSRAGVWRLLRLFASRGMPLTVFGVARALERNPLVAQAFAAAGHEIAGHGLRWLPYQEVRGGHRARASRRSGRDLPPAVRAGARWAGTPVAIRRTPAGWSSSTADSSTTATPMPTTSRTGSRVAGEAHLVVPYTLDNNDMRFASPAGFGWGGAFFDYLRDAFDTLYAEGEYAPKMLSVGLHCRLAGRPGRAAALARFLDHVLAHEKVWVTRRVDIARHWAAAHPSAYPAADSAADSAL